MNYKKLLSIILITLLIGILPSVFVGNSLDSLEKPFLYPPSISFMIVWPVLYILMSISVYLATEKENKPFIIYFRQLFLNALWTIAFFGFDLKLLGFIIIVALIILVIRMIREFYKQNKLSAYLLIPYLLWLIFAGYLNLAIYLLNR